MTTCPTPLGRYDRIVLGHGSGGTLSAALLRDVFLPVFDDPALRALEEFAEGGLSFELIGVKHIRAFDSNLVIVSIGVRGSAGTRLVGCYLADEEMPRGAALAVLNATNRLLGNYLATR